MVDAGRSFRRLAGPCARFSRSVPQPENQPVQGELQGVIATIDQPQLEAAAGEGAPKIRSRLEYLALYTQGYMVPPDLNYMRNRIKRRGDKSISFFSAALGTALDIKPILHCNRGETGPVAKVKGFDAAAEKMFDFASRRVRAGLMTPTISLSYGGDLDTMRALPGYQQLRDTCAEHNVEVYESLMSLSGMVNVGQGGLVVGFAAEPAKFE